MSKKLLSFIGVGALLLLAYVAAAWYCGKSYETQAQEDIQKANTLITQVMAQSNLPVGSSIRISQVSFKRGIFSSEAHYHIVPEGSPEGIPVVAHIQHGPFVGFHLARYQASYALEDTPLTNMIFKILDGKSPLTIVTRESFSKAVTINASIPPFKIANGQAKTDFSGMFLRAETDRDFSFLKGEMKIDQFSLGGVNSIDLVKLRSDFDLKYNGVFFVGKSDMSVDSLAYGGMTSMKLDKLSLTSDSKDGGRLNNSNMLLSIGNITVGKQDFGSLKWGVKLDNLDVPAYQKLTADVNSQAMKENEEELKNNLRTLLAAKPVLTMNPVEWTTPVGKSTVSMSIWFKAPPADTHPLNSPQIWQDLIEKSELKADLSKAMLTDVGSKIMQIGGMDAATAKTQAQTMLSQYMQQGIDLGFVKDGGTNYTVDTRLENGMLNINGKSMAVDDLLKSQSASSEAEGTLDESAENAENTPITVQ